MVRYFQEAAAGEQSHPLELDKQMRSRMERQFGLDFSAVRLVESDLPGKLGADAIAQGDLIRFAPGAFHPETAQGEQLLSHELSHVVQQSRGQGMGGVAGMPWVDAGTESSADAMAAQAMNGSLAAEPARSISPAPAASAPMLCGRTRQGKSKPPLGRRKRRPIPYHQKSQPSDLKLSYYERRAARENRNQFNPQDHPMLRKALTAIDKAENVWQAKAGLNWSGSIFVESENSQKMVR